MLYIDNENLKDFKKFSVTAESLRVSTTTLPKLETKSKNNANIKIDNNGEHWCQKNNLWHSFSQTWLFSNSKTKKENKILKDIQKIVAKK